MLSRRTTYEGTPCSAYVPIDSQTFESGESKRSIERRVLDLLEENPGKAYNVREITVEVMDLGLSERNVERPTDVQSFMAEFVDVATVTTILDRCVERGLLKRRTLDVGEGERSYYKWCR